LSPKKFAPHSVLSTQSNTLEKIEETNEEDENLGESDDENNNFRNSNVFEGNNVDEDSSSEFDNHNLEIIEREELENDVFFFF
jgi:hypothetical protein